MDQDYLPVLAEGFQAGSHSDFDVYVRLDSGRYLKLLEAGDQFTPERIGNYLKKGVTHFYIPRQMQKAYLEYSRRLSVATQVHLTLNQGDLLLATMKKQGVTRDNLEHAKTFISDVRNLSALLRTKNLKIASFLEDISAFEHGVATAIIAGILSHVLEIRMDHPVEIVGLAALLHDVGLAALPAHARQEEELDKMSRETLELFQTHPQLGAEILFKCGGINPAVTQAVEQHHMRHLGLGFPERKTHSPTLGRVAEIVGISEELARLMKPGKTQPPALILKELEKCVFPGFSRQIVYAFRTAFFPKT